MATFDSFVPEGRLPRQTPPTRNSIGAKGETVEAFVSGLAAQAIVFVLIVAIDNKTQRAFKMKRLGRKRFKFADVTL